RPSALRRLLDDPPPLAMSSLGEHGVTDAGEVVGGGHATSPNGSTRWASRFAAISQYRSSISMPMARRPSCFAATNVVPDPMKGSATAPGGHFPTSAAINATGFSVG